MRSDIDAMFELRRTLLPVLSDGVVGGIKIHVGVPVIVPSISDEIDEADPPSPSSDPVRRCDCKERGRRFPLCAAAAVFAINSLMSLTAAATTARLLILPLPEDSSSPPVASTVVASLLAILVTSEIILARFVFFRVLRSGSYYDPGLRLPPPGTPRSDQPSVHVEGYDNECDDDRYDEGDNDGYDEGDNDLRFGRDCDGCDGPERRLDLAWFVGTFLGCFAYAAAIEALIRRRTVPSFAMRLRVPAYLLLSVAVAGFAPVSCRPQSLPRLVFRWGTQTTQDN